MYVYISKIIESLNYIFINIYKGSNIDKSEINVNK